jgi:hypothetical protein
MSLMTGARPALARTGLVLGVAGTVLANVAYGAHYGLTGAVISAWPAVSFIVSSEILVGMVRARPATVPQDVAEVPGDVTETGTVPSAPAADLTVSAVPEIGVEAVPARTVLPRREARSSTVATRRAPVAKSKSPEHVFRNELAAGQLPSLRAVKSVMHVGTPRARAILAELADMIETPQAA